MIDMNEYAKELVALSIKRQENGAPFEPSVQGVLKHAAGEIIEAALSLGFDDISFEDMLSEQIYFDKTYSKVLEELSDVVATTMIAMHQLLTRDNSHAFPGDELSVEHYLKACLKKNRDRAEMKGDKL